jgi:RNA polymerase sigma-70 factor (ECF subfamily)
MQPKPLLSPAPGLPGGTAAALRRLAADPDPVAWAWLAEHEGPAMFRVAARLLGAAAADDACQEALLHIRDGARRFTPPPEGDADAAARAWLLRVTANAAAMWSRSERRRAARERVAADIPVAGGAAVGELDDLRAALAELPESQRLPVVLHHLGGQDFIAVAAACGTTPGAARVRAHRGLARLRERLVRAGVLVVGVSLLDRLAAEEVAMPADALSRWNTLLTTSTTPVATSAAIFGGLTTMTKIAIACAGLAVIGLLGTVTPTSPAEEHANRPVHAETTPKKEGADAMKTGTTGVSEGVIVSSEKGKLVLHTKDGNLLFMPRWHGGAPKDGGGLDQEVLARLTKFAVGDHVRIAWTWEERRRIDTISPAK